MTEATFLHIADFPEAPDGYTLATSSVSNAGTGLFLFVEAAKAEKVFATFGEPDGATFPETGMSEDAGALLIEIAPESVRRTDLSGINVTFPLIDKFPNGQILVVGGRAARYEDGSHDLNGLVFGPDGRLIRRMLLGDGIAKVACDGLGRIWASYFDEGVYGNSGWSMDESSTPIGAAGLVCFDDEGNVLWEFDVADPNGERHYIDDCYAINVKDDKVCIFYYSDFDLCEIDGDFRGRYCRTDLEGCSGLAAHGNQVLLTGQYSDGPDTGYLGTRSDGRLVDVRRIHLDIPGIDDNDRIGFIGRGPTLNVFHRNKWFQHDMALITA